VTGRTLMIQIANKSMLLDTKLGQRLLDDCVHPEQARLMAEAKAAAEAGLEAGLELAGFTTQANFLCGCGIDGLLAEIDPVSDLKTYWRAAQEIKHLLLPGAMGEIFKVMALSRNIGEPILGFQLRDLRDRL